MKTKSKMHSQGKHNRVATGSYENFPSTRKRKHPPPWLSEMIECNRDALATAAQTDRQTISDLSDHLRAKIALNNCFFPPSGAPRRAMSNPNSLGWAWQTIYENNFPQFNEDPERHFIRSAVSEVRETPFIPQLQCGESQHSPFPSLTTEVMGEAR